jgi:hypothetical protein
MHTDTAEGIYIGVLDVLRGDFMLFVQHLCCCSQLDPEGTPTSNIIVPQWKAASLVTEWKWVRIITSLHLHRFAAGIILPDFFFH